VGEGWQQVEYRLVTAKTQVAPKVKVTIQRMELAAAVNSVRLAKRVEGIIEDPSGGDEVSIFNFNFQFFL
jgi:hypothetical protein